MNKTYCPICNSRKDCNQALATVRHKDASFAIVFCNDCHMVLQHPAMSAQRRQKYYLSGYNLSNYQNNLEVTFQVMKPISEYRFAHICKQAGGIPEQYLEIGPGCGTLMKLFQDKGSVTIGVEPDQIAARWMCTEKKLNVYPGFFDDFVQSEAYNRYSQKFNVVVMSHVLEHIARPPKLLSQVKKLLSTEGILFVEVPNVLKPYSDGKRWQDHCDPGHLYYYSPTTLQYLLERAGYQVLSMVTNEYPPYFPIFCVAQPCLVPPTRSVELNPRNNIHQIRRNWLRLRIKHYIYYYPRRLTGRYLRRVKGK